MKRVKSIEIREVLPEVKAEEVMVVGAAGVKRQREVGCMVRSRLARSKVMVSGTVLRAASTDYTVQFFFPRLKRALGELEIWRVLTDTVSEFCPINIP